MRMCMCIYYGNTVINGVCSCSHSQLYNQYNKHRQHRQHMIQIKVDNSLLVKFHPIIILEPKLLFQYITHSNIFTIGSNANLRILQIKESIKSVKEPIS